jgi:hypothetical protein
MAVKICMMVFWITVALKAEAIRFSETPTTAYKATRRHNLKTTYQKTCSALFILLQVQAVFRKLAPTPSRTMAKV